MSHHPATLVDVPRFEPFTGLRFATDADIDVTSRTSPPYDVFDEATRAGYASANPHNIVLVDYPVEADGPNRYVEAAARLDAWRQEGILARDAEPAFYVYRMSFVDETGSARNTVGVVGALEVVDEGAGGVLPHEKTTPKAKTDRLDLTRATHCNLSPVWGLSLSAGLSSILADPGTVVARCTDEQNVEHVLERIDDEARIDRIRAAVSAEPVLIADGHHRYAISRSFRDECRGTALATASETTLTFVQELVEEQLSVAAIHRMYDTPADDLLPALESHYDVSDCGVVDESTIAEMARRGALCLVDRELRGRFLAPREELFEGIRALDSARLEHCLSSIPHDVSYQHGITEVISRLRAGQAEAAILIRPVSLAEIRRTATTGELMPPKSTFFTPKLRTGMIMRPLSWDDLR